ncbi:unnamed protein product [Urochloa humidicola]
MLQVEAAAATTARRSQHRQRDDRPRTKTSSGIPTPSLPCHCPPLQWRRHADDRRLWLRRQSRCACDQRRAAADVMANAAMSSTVLGGGSHSALPSAAVAPMTKGKVWRNLRLAVPATEVSGVPVRLLGPQRLRIREAFVPTDAPKAASRWPPSSEPRWCRAPAPPFWRLS